MLVDLFTTFDSQTYMTQGSWVKTVMVGGFSMLLTVMFSGGKWVNNSNLWNQFIAPLMGRLWSETKLVAQDSFSPLVYIGAGWFMVATIYWQIVPGVWLTTAHLALTACVAVSVWTAMIVASSMTSTNMFLTGFVPDGSPLAMAPSLVVVELFSHLMRPIALGARLILTVCIGHIIMVLLSIFSSEFPFFTKGSMIPMMSGLGLTLVELVISTLQAYIFFMLVLFFNTQYPRYN